MGHTEKSGTLQTRLSCNTHSLIWSPSPPPHLTQVHDDALVDLLPQVGTEDLDKGDLQCGNFAMHEDARQVQLHLEAHIHLQKGGQTEFSK